MNLISFHWKMFKIKRLRKTFEGKDWQLTIGPDMWNDHAGFTFHGNEVEPMGDWRRWKFNLRVNFQSPVSWRLR